MCSLLNWQLPADGSIGQCCEGWFPLGKAIIKQGQLGLNTLNDSPALEIPEEPDADDLQQVSQVGSIQSRQGVKDELSPGGRGEHAI